MEVMRSEEVKENIDSNAIRNEEHKTKDATAFATPPRPLVGNSPQNSASTDECPRRQPSLREASPTATRSGAHWAFALGRAGAAGTNGRDAPPQRARSRGQEGAAADGEGSRSRRSRAHSRSVSECSVDGEEQSAWSKSLRQPSADPAGVRPWKPELTVPQEPNLRTAQRSRSRSHCSSVASNDGRGSHTPRRRHSQAPRELASAPREIAAIDRHLERLGSGRRTPSSSPMRQRRLETPSPARSASGRLQHMMTPDRFATPGSLGIASDLMMSTESRWSRLSQRSSSQRVLGTAELEQMRIDHEMRELKRLMSKNEKAFRDAINNPEDYLSVASRLWKPDLTMPHEPHLRTAARSQSCRRRRHRSRSVDSDAESRPSVTVDKMPEREQLAVQRHLERAALASPCSQTPRHAWEEQHGEPVCAEERALRARAAAQAKHPEAKAPCRFFKPVQAGEQGDVGASPADMSASKGSAHTLLFTPEPPHANRSNRTFETPSASSVPWESSLESRLSRLSRRSHSHHVLSTAALEQIRMDRGRQELRELMHRNKMNCRNAIDNPSNPLHSSVRSSQELTHPQEPVLRTAERARSSSRGRSRSREPEADHYVPSAQLPAREQLAVQRHVQVVAAQRAAEAAWRAKRDLRDEEWVKEAESAEERARRARTVAQAKFRHDKGACIVFRPAADVKASAVAPAPAAGAAPGCEARAPVDDVPVQASPPAPGAEDALAAATDAASSEDALGIQAGEVASPLRTNSSPPVQPDVMSAIIAWKEEAREQPVHPGPEGYSNVPPPAAAEGLDGDEGVSQAVRQAGPAEEIISLSEFEQPVAPAAKGHAFAESEGAAAAQVGASPTKAVSTMSSLLESVRPEASAEERAQRAREAAQAKASQRLRAAEELCVFRTSTSSADAPARTSVASADAPTTPAAARRSTGSPAADSSPPPRTEPRRSTGSPAAASPVAASPVAASSPLCAEGALASGGDSEGGVESPGPSAEPADADAADGAVADA